MKQQSFFLVAVLLFLGTLNCFSQNAKPALFKNYPDKVKCSIGELSKIFSKKRGADIELDFSHDFKIKGIVISNEIKYSNLQSIVIKIPSLNNSICHFSKIINADKSIFYSGQIINQFSEDCFLLKNDANNNYQFIKTNLEALIPTCSMP